jgi:hypothetical protein
MNSKYFSDGVIRHIYTLKLRIVLCVRPVLELELNVQRTSKNSYKNRVITIYLLVLFYLYNIPCIIKQKLQ